MQGLQPQDVGGRSQGDGAGLIGQGEGHVGHGEDEEGGAALACICGLDEFDGAAVDEHVVEAADRLEAVRALRRVG